MSGKAGPLEKIVQRDVIAYLHARGITTAHVPNGSVLAGDAKARAMQVNALKKAGMRVGFPDLICLASGGRVGFMEVKREGEKLGENQIHWAGALEHLGHHFAVVRSVADAEETLSRWGWVGDCSFQRFGDVANRVVSDIQAKVDAA
jgi:hypothetical protein